MKKKIFTAGYRGGYAIKAPPFEVEAEITINFVVSTHVVWSQKNTLDFGLLYGKHSSIVTCQFFLLILVLFTRSYPFQLA